MELPKGEDIKKILPSKKFVIAIGTTILVLVVILFLSSIFGTEKVFDSKLTNSPMKAGGTVGDIITRDSNSNGISDWEETLWGLEPTADGIENKKIIDAKKLAQNVPIISEKNEEVSATEEFSQDLLATIIALKQSGSLTEGAINDLAESISGSVDAKHANVRTYALSDMHTTNAVGAKQKYYKALKAVVDSYKDVDLGNELSIIATGLGTGGPGQLKLLDPYISAYSNLSKQILALETPTEIAPSALVLVNTSAVMGGALGQIENFYKDVLSGMVGLDDYTKAKELSDKASKEISEYFNRI